MDVSYRWRVDFANADVNALHAEGFDHPILDIDWRAQVGRHSLGWVCAFDQEQRLVGFVNVAWDGGVHAFMLDTLVDRKFRHRGIGTGLIQMAVAESAHAGCEWLHVDFPDDLSDFYLTSCTFTSTPAGLLALTSGAAVVRTR
jgi:ribosomal protein S18 acetylase RimI-like enzyme